MLNPFLLAGLVFAAVGLIQEATEADNKQKPATKPKAVSAPVVIPAVKKPKEKPAKNEPIVEPLTDG